MRVGQKTQQQLITENQAANKRLEFGGGCHYRVLTDIAPTLGRKWHVKTIFMLDAMVGSELDKQIFYGKHIAR